MERNRQLIVVANRLPVRRVTERGQRRWVTSPGGLVSALAPVMANSPNALWIGWAGATGTAPEPFEHDGLQLHPVSLSRAEVQQYYEGFSNATLWPLYHDAIAAPEYHRTWWDDYVTVNRRFAETVVDRAEEGALVWVHDYQLQLVPGLLRELRPDLRIGFFLHIPFPAREIFLRLPWRTELVDALLGADLLGFQTEVMAHNFRHLVPRVTARDSVELRGETVLLGERSVETRTCPIGIDHTRFGDAALLEETTTEVEKLRQQLDQPRTVLLGVDRLDYTKGIERRLQAFGELLDEDRLSSDDVVLIQIAEPSRSNVNGYSEIRAAVERTVGEINGNFGSMTRPAIHYLHRSHDFRELTALYRLADVMLVTPFRDGMNLVAKEYVATRYDHTGTLVLSESAGAAHELHEAVLVNPYDTEGLKDAIETAVFMPAQERARRMEPMRDTVCTANALRWATEFLEGLQGEIS
ncbi:MAG: trehalose-6-phosphate synthase [Acidobacteriota bacterium]